MLSTYVRYYSLYTELFLLQALHDVAQELKTSHQLDTVAS